MTDPTLVGVLYFLVTSLLGVGIWVAKAIYKGDLLPRASVEYISKENKDQLDRKNAEVAEWKALYEAERAVNMDSRGNRDILLAVSKTMDKVLRSLPTSSDDVGAGGS